MKLIRLGIAVAISCLAISPKLHAQCAEDPRIIEMGGGASVRLKSFLCRTDGAAEGRAVKVEFHRLSEKAANLIVSNGPLGNFANVIGSPTIVQNEVFDAYTKILAEFGKAVDLSWVGHRVEIEIEAAGRGGSGTLRSDIGSSALRRLTDTRTDYPAIEEVTALTRGIIPNNLRHYRYAACDNETSIPRKPCKHFPRSSGLIFWRGMSIDDVTKYGARIAAYNRRGPGTLESTIPKVLRFAQHIARDIWPEDFLVLVGSTVVTGDSCPPPSGGRPTTKDWSFEVFDREIIMDVTLIENLSDLSIQLSEFFGYRSDQTRLRAARPPTESKGALELASLTLGPKQRALIATRITLAPPLYHSEFFDEPTDKMLSRFGTYGFRGNTAAHGRPPSRDYVFGPEIALRGFLVDGKRIELARPSANFLSVDARITEEIGSCPYLMSWDDRSREWIDHGKLLGRASTRQREYVETRVFPGFKGVFRIEEREPEIAFIRAAELALKLRDGGTLVLQTASALPNTEDGYVKLLWGDQVDLRFVLPPGIEQDDVVESRLSVTGYYERYSGAQPPVSFNSAPAGRTPSVSTKASAPDYPPAACPAPAPAAPPQLNIRRLLPAL